jgi:TPR repeat protein
MRKLMISYAGADRAAAAAMASSLSAFGMKVWWDIALKPGHAYAREIDSVIRDVDHVIVMWSSQSVQSEWVLAEASLAKDLGKLLPIMIAPCEPVVHLRLLHTPRVLWNADQERFDSLDILTGILLGEAPGQPAASHSFAETEISCIPSRELIARALRRRTFEQIEHDAKSDVVSKWLIGSALLDGISIPADPIRAAQIVAECARSGFARAMHSEAIVYAEGLGGTRADMARAVALLREAADRGVAMSQWLLGVWTIYGRNVPRNESAAFQLLHKAALQGHARAQGEVGNCFNYGRGTMKDSREAIHWLERGAASGDTFSLRMLGAIAADGEFPGKSHDYAAKQFEAAYHAGDANGALDLGRFLLEKKRSTYDPELAARWSIRAGNAGLGDGFVQAAQTIISANGGLNHVEDPVYLLAQGADLSHPLALVILGEALLNPKLGKINKKNAREAFQQALALPSLATDLKSRASNGIKRCGFW